MDTGTGYYGHVTITAGTVRGRALLDPVLEIELKIQADGLAPGVAAMILASCHVQGPSCRLTSGRPRRSSPSSGSRPSRAATSRTRRASTPAGT